MTYASSSISSAHDRTCSLGSTSNLFLAFSLAMLRTCVWREPSLYTVIPLRPSSCASRYAAFTSVTDASCGMLIVFAMAFPIHACQTHCASRWSDQCMSMAVTNIFCIHSGTSSMPRTDP